MSFLKRPEKKWKYVYLGQEQDDEEGHWVTIGGRHVFIKGGEPDESEEKKGKGLLMDSLDHMIFLKNTLRQLPDSGARREKEKEVVNHIERIMEHIKLSPEDRDRVRRAIGVKK